jgi:hypothetical protein
MNTLLRLSTGKQLFRRGWMADYVDGYDFLGEMDGVSGFPNSASGGNWNPITYTNLLNQAIVTPDDDARAALYAQADRLMVMTDTAMIPLFYSATGILTKPRLQRTFDSGGYGARIAEWRLLPTMSVSPVRANGLVGTPLTVTVAITSAPATGAFAFTLVYSPSQVTVQAFALGPFLGSTGRTPVEMVKTISNTAGTATYAVGSGTTNAGASGGGILAYIRLTPQVTGVDLLRLTATALAADDIGATPIAHAAQNGLLNVPARPGDLNGSGAVTVGDIQLSAYAYGSHPGDPSFNVLYDLNNDGVINLTDLQRVAYLWGTVYPAGQMAQALEPQLTQPFTLTLRQGPGFPAVGGTFTASVAISNVAGLGAFQFSMGYVTSTVQVVGAEVAGFPGSTGRSFSAVGPTINNISGTLTFGAYSIGDPPELAGPSGDGALAIITFLAMEPGQTTLQFSGIEVDDPAGSPQTPASAPEGSLVIGYKVFLPLTVRAYP